GRPARRLRRRGRTPSIRGSWAGIIISAMGAPVTQAEPRAQGEVRRKLVHTEIIPLRWGDMDAMGHVNNTVYFRFMEQARIGWFDALVPEADAWKNTGIVIATTTCNFRRPMTYP